MQFDYINENWSNYFDIIEIIKGDDPSRYLLPEKSFYPDGDISLFRPMGQDLVIARKK